MQNNETFNYGFTAPVTVEDHFEQNAFDKIALIDADRLKYLVTVDISSKINETGSTYCRTEINDFIENRLGRMIFNRFTAKSYLFCFSGNRKETFRYFCSFDREYKGKRKEPQHYYEGMYEDMSTVVKYIQKRHPTLLFKDLEADDIVSMLQCEHTFIMSNDKDLKQVPGLHYNFDSNRLDKVTPKEGFKHLIAQIYQGDTADNFRGLVGFGPKKIEKAFEEENIVSLFYQCIENFMKVHGMMNGIDTFVEMWTMAKMKDNRGDYFKEKYIHAFDTLESLIQQI